jgi:hypothetical protein
MGYLGKLGNILGDAASFAVPAGVSFGLSALSAGTLNPGTMALLGSLGAGAQGLQGNEQQERLRKMQLAQLKANEGAQAQTETSMGRANLINALKPGAGARGSITQAQQVATPKAGLMENIAGGIGTGATMASQVMQAQQMAKDAAARRALVEAQTGVLNAKTGALGNMGTMTQGSQLAGQSPDPGSDQSKSFLSSIAKIAGQGGTSEEIGGRLGNVPVPMRGEANRGGNFFEAIPAASERLGDVLPAVGGIDNAPEVQAAISEGLRTGETDRLNLQKLRDEVGGVGGVGGMSLEKRRAILKSAQAEAIALAPNAPPNVAWQSFLNNTRGLDLTQDESAAFLTAIEGAGDQYKLGEVAKTAMAKMLTLSSSADELVSRLEDPAIRENFSLYMGKLKDYANKGGMLRDQILDPETSAFLTQLGLTQNLMARIETGAAINDTEYKLFWEELTGGLVSDPDNLRSRLTAIRDGYATRMQDIFRAEDIARGRAALPTYAPPKPTTSPAGMPGARALQYSPEEIDAEMRRRGMFSAPQAGFGVLR